MQKQNWFKTTAGMAVATLAIGGAAQADVFTVDFSAAANDQFSGNDWTFDFAIDGTGNISVTTGGDFGDINGGSATVTGSTTDPTLFNTSFSVTLDTPLRFFGVHGSNGGWGINGGANNFRLDNGDGQELISFDWDLTGLPAGYTLQLTGFSSDLIVAAGRLAWAFTNNANTAFTTSDDDGSFIDVTSVTPVLDGGTDPASGNLSVGFGGDIRLDQWQFEIIPEPGSLGLASLGLLAIAARRRS
ncbi:MAG: PEP-CTERM sorting domain-containing protein [Planctomycetota bacterium]